MRVVQVVHSPQRRGAEVFARDLAGALREAGHPTATVYLYDHQGGAPLPVDPDDVVLGGRPDHPLELGAGCHPRLLARLLATLRALDPDIVQVNGSRTVKYGALARRLARPRWRLVYRNIGDPRQWVVGAPRRLLYRHLVMAGLDGFVAVSEASLEGLRSLYRLDIPAARIPRGVDLSALVPSRTRQEMRAATATPPSAPVLLFAGSLRPEKRVDRLARVFRKVLHQVPEAHLWVAGEGPDRPVLATELESSGAYASARILGPTPGIADHLGAADLLVLTSDTEGIPGVVLEAGGAGLPVVATAVGGVAECVAHGRTGLIVEPSDEAAFADAVVDLLNDDARRAAMGREARAWVEERFSMARIASDYLAFYGEILGSRPGPAEGRAA